MEFKEIHHTDEETRLFNPTLLCTHGPADPKMVKIVLDAHVDSPDEYDGRSEFRWFRLADGTLILGVFPHGDTYLQVESDPGRP